MDKTLNHVREGFAGQRLVRLPPAALARARRLGLARDLFPTDLGHFPETRSHWVVRPRGCENHIFIYNVRGRGWVEISNRRWAVPPEHAVLIPAPTAHRYASDEAIPWEIYWFHFNGLQSAAILDLFAIEDGIPLFFLPAAAALSDAFEDVYRWTNEGFSDGALFGLSAGLKRFFSLAHAHRRSPGERLRESEERILKVIGRMRAQPADSRELSAWAREAGLSAPHFTALFKRQTGCPPIRFLNRMRLQKACEMLDLSNAPINAIGREVGFEDPFYFCRLFRKGVGVSPREYRRRVKG